MMADENIEGTEWLILCMAIGVFFLWPGVIKRLMIWYEKLFYKGPAGRRGYSPEVILLFIKWFLRLFAAFLLITGLAGIIALFVLPRILGR